MSAVLRLDADSLREVALDQGVCIRPVMHEVYDTVTRQTRLIPVACGGTRESKCPPCAQKNRRLRMQQCREGWHLDQEPQRQAAPPRDEEEQVRRDEVQPVPERRLGATPPRHAAPPRGGSAGGARAGGAEHR